MLTAVAVFSVLLVLTGCPSAAGGTNSGKIDYAARLIGTWKTKGYDKGEFVEVPVSHPYTGTRKIREQITFTGNKIIITSESKDSSYSEYNYAEITDSDPILEITSDSFLIKGRIESENFRAKYEIINNILYIYWGSSATECQYYRSL